jgi:hypothetical protein
MNLEQKLMANLLDHLERCRTLRDRELAQLADLPAPAIILREFMDAIFGDLTYLCNYTKAVDGNGKDHAIVDVIQELQTAFGQTFKQLTGKQYVPETVRIYREGRPIP